MTPPPPSLKDAAGRLFDSANAKRLIPLVFAVVFGVVGLAVANRWKLSKERALVQQKQALEKERQTLMANYQQPIEVVVAAKDIPEGAMIDASLLTTAQVPERFVQPYSVRTPQELVGKIAVAPIAAHEQILTNKLRKADAVPAGATLSTMTPKGTRAVTIAVDIITGVGGFVRPGDKVDILWTVKEGDQIATFTLFQEVPVLAVGTEMAGRPAPSGKGEGQASQMAQQGYTVTLALAPPETSALLFAREQGKIQLSLRPRLEAGQMPIPPANISTLLEAQLGTPAQAAPPVTRQVEVYKGLKRDVVALAEEQ